MQSNKWVVEDIITVFKAKGIKQIVFSPGSRNAPLVIGFANDPYFETISLPDERSAAFFATGMSLQQKRPVAICCTSGSALLNYSPAVAEAYYQNIPLVILSADRPSIWIDQGAGQTLRQPGVYANFTKAESHLLSEENENTRWYNRRELSEKLDLSMEANKGPVHFNVPFFEPLYQTKESEVSTDFVSEKIMVSKSIDEEAWQNIVNEWEQIDSILVICGQNDPNSVLLDQLIRHNESDQIVVLTETSSNLYNDGFVNCIDRTIEGIKADNVSGFVPDLIISIGEAIVSKKIKAFFQNNKPKAHWHIGTRKSREDVFQSLKKHIPIEADEFLKLIPIKSSGGSNFKTNWQLRASESQKFHDSYLSACQWSDLKAFDLILNHISKGSVLHLGNSTPIRYAQLFENKKGIVNHANRGVSGIDGCVSTACGYAFKSDKRNYLVVGDLSFVYDSNALWNLHLKGNLTIIVINNAGGGIFSIIPGPKTSPQWEDYFNCHHPANIEKLTQAFGCDYLDANSSESCLNALELIENTKHNKPIVLELKTFNSDNAQVLKEYFEKVKQK